MEHTTVNPMLFEKGGNIRRKNFKDWQDQVKANLQPVNTFEFGTFTLRESLKSLKHHFARKCERAKEWSSKHSERWLLLQLIEGSPFGYLMTGEPNAISGYGKDFSDHLAKVLFEVCVILAEPSPFDSVIIFSGCAIVAFPGHGKNPHRLPMPRWDIITRGAGSDDSHLDWTAL
jgi:hypothetical protein